MYRETVTESLSPHPYALLFPGQGAQCVGMVKDVLPISPAARDIVARADEALHTSLSTLLLEGPEEILTATENAQPALLTASIALLAALRERVPSLPLPGMAAGHSLGEYTAWVAAGAMSFEDAVRIVRARGKAMHEACPTGGTMAAILGLDVNTVYTLCRQGAEGEVVGPANFNAPGQVVIAGHAGAVARVSVLVANMRGKAIPLNVSGPFHSSLMRSAAHVLEQALSGVSFAPPAFPVVANADAIPYTRADAIPALLVSQVASPVRWAESVAVLHQQGIRLAVEIGPGKVLAGLVKRTCADIMVLNLHDAGSLEQVATFFATAQQGTACDPTLSGGSWTSSF